ncbi:MAG: hypothetical protein ACXV7G_01240 [Halobacteriota archaeon]
MTLNEPVNGSLATPNWQQNELDRLNAIEKSLEAALWAKENIKRPDLLHAGFEVSLYRDAINIFKKAVNAELTSLSAGFGPFSCQAKYRKEDRFKQFEVLSTYDQQSREFEGTRFHASEGSAVNAFELLACANVTSADGSSAVIAGIAYRSVLTATGKLIKANKLAQWECNCNFCSDRQPHDAVNELQRTAEVRVRHNVNVVRSFVARINDALANDTIAELTEPRLTLYNNKALWKCWDIMNKRPTSE